MMVVVVGMSYKEKTKPEKGKMGDGRWEMGDE